MTTRRAATRYNPATGRSRRTGPEEDSGDFGGLAGVAEARLAAALAPRPDPDRFPTVQSRQGEARRPSGALQQFRALYTSPWFWEMAAEFPRNTLTEGRPGRPQTYPDYLLALCWLFGGATALGSTSAALKQLSDPRVWAVVVDDIDRYVPEGWTRLADLRPSETCWERASRPRVNPVGAKPDGTRALAAARARTDSGQQRPPLPCPTRDQVKYFEDKIRGYRRQNNQRAPLAPGDEYYGLRHRLLEAFERYAVVQAQGMGLLRPDMRFQFKNPDHGQYVLADGTVFRLRRPGPSTEPVADDTTSAGDHYVGGGRQQVYGTKFDIVSTRIHRQPYSRVILALGHVGTDPDSLSRGEDQATVTLTRRLHEGANGGLHGLISDSAVRGKFVTELQRAGIVCVNYPHADENPEGGDGGRRLAPGRVEKSHIAQVLSHDRNGVTCEHYLYWLGGSLIEKYRSHDGTWDVRLVPITGYKSHRNGRGGRAPRNAGHTCREYLHVAIPCTEAGTLNARVPLFHQDAVDGGANFNRGEVVRVFAPGSAEFLGLYPSRNDTESRHTELKQRIKYMPRDVAGQQMKVLAAAIALNAQTWQYHLQAHGEPNVLDDTA